MFDNLIESRPQKRNLKQNVSTTILSAVIHTGLVAAALFGTMKTTEFVQALTADTTMVFLQEEEQQQEEEQEQPPVLASLDPPPRGFQTLSAPIDIPTEIPPIDLTQRFDPRDYSGVGVEGGIATGIEGGTGPVDLDQVFIEAVVDEPPMRLSGPQPVYPPLLRDAGIEGTVLVEFIIGADGHPESESVRIISTTNRAFDRSARDVVLGSIYRPGRVRGQAVRVLVRQPISYTIPRR